MMMFPPPVVQRAVAVAALDPQTRGSPVAMIAIASISLCCWGMLAHLVHLF